MNDFKTICQNIEVHRHITNCSIMSKTFMKNLPSARPKMVPKIKMFRIY